ncbi:MAG: anthranilate synthase component I family protein [Natrialbaceae archaeon]|nr:anthranilate synthase component I family protein [Natrialbaceae archaeon]
MDGARIVTSLADFEQTVEQATIASTLRVPIEVRTSVEDPFDAYCRARDGGQGAFLETSGGRDGWGYFGVDPVDHLTVSASATTRTRRGESPTLAALAGLLETCSLARGDCTVPYPAGVIGWLSYDIAREIESLPTSARTDRPLPRLEVGVYDRLAAWSCPARGDRVELHVTACPRVGDDVAEAYRRGRERALELVRRLNSGTTTVDFDPDRGATSFRSECGKPAFADRVRRIKAAIQAGETFQANVSQRFTAPASVHPVTVYGALRERNPAPYSCLLEERSLDLVSASPELLLAVDGETVRTEPIAGTRPRGETSTADDRLETELTSDAKEQAEHAMLVDLERNDLGKICRPGSVTVEEYRRVDRYSEVMHLVSEVCGERRPDTSLAEVIEALFPGGTITGAPKPRTMALIDEVEATRRGPYTGAVGLFGFDERATLNIVIRTLVRRDDTYSLRVGAGIVHDSRPDREYAETLDKARALIAAVDDALEQSAMTVEATGGGGRG